jgi:hypothetical protein
MLRRILLFSLPVFAAGMLVMPVNTMSEVADPDAAHLKAGHQKVEGVVTDIKSGIYTVKTKSGTYTLGENASIRHGHGAPKVGDAMILWVSENNMVIDAHPKAQTAKAHRSISGKLVNLDNVKSEIRLSTSEGETTLKIKPETRSFVDIPKGAPVTIELNESGEVIDIHIDQR